MSRKQGDIQYDAAFKEEVRAARRAGTSYGALAERFGINIGTAHRWCNPRDRSYSGDHVVVSVSVTPADRDALLALAAANGETISQAMRRVIATAVPQPEPAPRERFGPWTERAIAELRGEGDGE